MAQVRPVLGNTVQALAQQLAFVKAPFGVDARFVVRKRLQLGIGQKLQLGDTNTVLARNHAIQRTRQRHDALDCLVRCLQHGVIVAVDRDIGVHIAIARMHMQRHPDTPLKHAFVDGHAFLEDGRKSRAGKYALQRSLQLRFPTGAQAVVLQLREQGIHIVQPALPLRAYASNQVLRLR